LVKRGACTKAGGAKKIFAIQFKQSGKRKGVLVSKSIEGERPPKREKNPPRR